MAVVFLDKHGAILVDSARIGATTNAGPCQGTITGLKEAVCHKTPIVQPHTHCELCSSGLLCSELR